MRVFVTGGTGLLGNTVIRQLIEAGDEVVALVRSDPDPAVFDALDVELVHSELVSEDLGSAQSLSDPGQCDPVQSGPDLIDDSIANCDAVIHAAAMIHLGWTQLDQSIHVNEGGTRRIVDACLRHGKKLIWVGSVNTIAVGSPQTLADETTPLEHAGGQVECSYVQSKRKSVAVVRQAVQDGLDAVIVHPGFMLGPWDWKPSSGRMMLEVGKSWKPISPSGGCSLCDSRDVATGTIAALKKSTASGREYILAGHNWTYQRLWTEMATRMGTRPPLRPAGPGLEYLAGLAGDVWTRLSGKEPDVNSAGVTMSGQYHWYTSKRAQQELGYQTRAAEQTLDAAADWIRNRFILPADAAAG
ncbi:SDR family oxidoreductase [Stieleria sp. TO1_6]|uniref:NAD-dependent epimerase/dehydratase family protein n=1 Tax=Stieleria tagensis TaxID=2956795 RepID=UPI00209A826F|nr:NAD-dependent epimerase/dehydratase family protein [Stieleria tagensis]MCO8121567.1 SDR family oxidoreductase [Stieleria tagensis]